jgi:SAM-dependent methyltransferase
MFQSIGGSGDSHARATVAARESPPPARAWPAPRVILEQLVGNAAAHAFASARDDHAALVDEILSLSYRLHLGPEGGTFFRRSFDTVLLARARGEDVLPAFAAARAEFARTDLPRRRRRYKQGSLLRSLRLAGLDRGFTGTLVDVGAGDNGLGARLVGRCAGEASVVGVDFREQARDAMVGPGLEFRELESADVLPVDSSAADACTFRFSLHHMAGDVQEAMVAEALRVVRPGGRLIVFEDASSSETPVVDNALHRRVRDVVAAGGHRELLALLDASSCLIDDESMPFPFSFRTVEEWVALLEELGAADVEATYWGMPMFSLFQAPLAVIRGTKR